MSEFDNVNLGTANTADKQDESKADTMTPLGQPRTQGHNSLMDAHASASQETVSSAGIDTEKQDAGDGKFNRLGWKRLTVVLIVEAIALGCLGLPKSFAVLGMVPGVICSVGIGLIAIYTSHIVGQVKIKYPHVAHYADAGKLLAGKFGYELIGAMFVLQLVFLVGSHCLTGTIAFDNIANGPNMCALIFGVVSAIILLGLAIPPSFSEVAILGYIDFVSIIAAVLITMIATGIQRHSEAASDWSAWPKEGTSFASAFIAISNILFAYSFAICQFSFMDEMHTPKDYVKSIWTLGIIEIFIYTVTGAVIYAFVGQDVQSPALLSAGPTISRIAFGVALPVIFISGSINTTVVSRYIIKRVFKDSPIGNVVGVKGWAYWLGLVSLVTIIAWVIAEAIPFFEDLLSISSSLFISGFTFYFPAWMWFKLIREGPLFSRKNIVETLANIFITLIGLVTLVAGTYASIKDIVSSKSLSFAATLRIVMLIVLSRCRNMRMAASRAHFHAPLLPK